MPPICMGGNRTESPTSPPSGPPTPPRVLPASKATKEGLTGGGVIQDMLLSLSPRNKPFLLKLDLSAFSFGLQAPWAFGGYFA